MKMALKTMILSLLVCIVTMSILHLTGIPKKIIRTLIEDLSGYAETSEFQQYQKYLASGLLNSNGLYQELMLNENEETENKGILITFSANTNLNIRYYFDENRTKRIDAEKGVGYCYLEPGDCVYADVSVSKTMNDTIYGFKEFEIAEIEDTISVIRKDLNGAFEADNCVLRIPDDYTGKHISVRPVGEFFGKDIQLSDYYLDNNENRHDLNGTWVINDLETIDEFTSLKPFTSYIINYQYDPDQYFYLQSKPDPYYLEENDGIIEFDQMSVEDNIESFEVKLHEYINIEIVSDNERTVRVDGQEKIQLKTNGILRLSHHKYGDRVIIETNKNWDDLSRNTDIVLLDSVNTPDSTFRYRYTVMIPEKDAQFLFDPADYVFEHGTVRFKCYGDVVRGKIAISKGNKIFYEQYTADEGYGLEPGSIVVGNKEETEEMIQNIHFVKMTQQTITLLQPDKGGKITYKVKGSPVKLQTVTLYSGDVITMEFLPWEGWECKYLDGIEYTVSPDNSYVMIDGKDISKNAFVEVEGHKPLITITLNNSVGENTNFKITSSGKDIADGKGQFGAFSGNYDLIKDYRIGTEDNIHFVVSGTSIQSGHALRFKVIRTEKDDGGSKERNYFATSLSKEIEIPIFEIGKASTSKVWYKSIRIEVSSVKITPFKQPVPKANTTIRVINLESGVILKEGDIIDDSQKVKFIIEANNDYYVTGSKVTAGVFAETSKYSEYLKNLNYNISNHPAEKYIHVFLDHSDLFAEYTYTTASKTVTDEISVKANQTVKLKYTISDLEYKIKKDASWYVWESDTSVEKELKITRSMDGRTLTRKEFGIYLVGE